MPIVLDSMLYFNEIELFCARYDLLKESVDKFCIFESCTTFTGLPKLGNFYTDLEQTGFEVDRSRIKYYLVDALPDRISAELSGKYGYELQMLSDLDANVDSHWFKEHLSRELLKRTFEAEPLDAIILISDIDEIPTPQAIDVACKMIADFPATIISIEMMDYIGSIGCLKGNTWEGTFVMTKFNAMNTCLSSVRTLSGRPAKRNCSGIKHISNGGWHFSSFGGAHTVKSKIMAWGHQELNRWDIRLFIGANIALGKDIFGRDLFSNAGNEVHELPYLRPSDYFLPGKIYSDFILGAAKVELGNYLLRYAFIVIQLFRRIFRRLGFLRE